jgi:hypothetical protein
MAAIENCASACFEGWKKIWRRKPWGLVKLFHIFEQPKEYLSTTASSQSQIKSTLSGFTFASADWVASAEIFLISTASAELFAGSSTDIFQSLHNTNGPVFAPRAHLRVLYKAAPGKGAE